jgi:hypothetical protein
MDTTPMSEAGTVFHPTGKPTYRVELPPGDHLIVVAGVFYGTAGSRFSHPNVVAKQSRMHDFKHYRENGSKFWTSRAGINLLFVIPKDKIHLVHEEGHSYVPVVINGEKCRLNVSGGTKDGWTDWVRQRVHVGCGCSQKTLRRLADVALTPAECRAQGITINLEETDDHDSKRLIDFATQQLIQRKLAAGHRIVLAGTTIDGNQGPFEIEKRGADRKGRKTGAWIVRCPGYPPRCRVTAKHIDWVETAKASGLEVAELVSVVFI